MLKLKLNNGLATSLFLNGSGKLAYFQEDGSLRVIGIPKLGRYVTLSPMMEYYLTDTKVKFLKQAIDEYNSNRGPSIS